MENYDVVMIGAGHSRLVCAAYLLKEGYRSGRRDFWNARMQLGANILKPAAVNCESPQRIG